MKSANSKHAKSGPLGLASGLVQAAAVALMVVTCGPAQLDFLDWDCLAYLVLQLVSQCQHKHDV